jgi:carbamoyl-phosphate synthase large subunit
MRSTGEVMSFGVNFPAAFAKAQIAAGNPLPTEGNVLVSLADPDKREGTALAAQLNDMGFDLIATAGTAQTLASMGIPVQTVHKVGEGRPDCVDLIAQGKVSLVVNTPSASYDEVDVTAPPVPETAESRGVPLPWQAPYTAGYKIRNAALTHHIPYITTLVAFRAGVAAIRHLRGTSLTAHKLAEVG